MPSKVSYMRTEEVITIMEGASAYDLRAALGKIRERAVLESLTFHKTPAQEYWKFVFVKPD